MLADQTHQNLIKNQTNGITSHIHWISGHANIPNNEKADQLIKLTLNINVISSNRFLSFDFIKNQIIKFNQNEWKLLWIKNSKKKRYQKFDVQSKNSKIKYLNNQSKLITATIMQLKIGHDYFNSYLKNLINHSKSSKCYVLVRKNPQKNQPSWDQLKTVKIIKFDHELIVVSRHFYSFPSHTTRGENAVKVVNKHQKSFLLVTFG